MASWRVELLGGLRVLGEGVLITQFEARKTTALLALLALRPERVHPREELIVALWPDAELESGRNRLKQALSMLRKRLGPIFETSHFGIRLLPGAVETDTAQWEALIGQGRLREAEALWRGELLPGFYEDPLALERERLAALRDARVPPEGARSARQVHLPRPLTPFVGREPELSALAEHLKSARWVTITGPGGMGKTRLALEAARQRALDDLYFVSLIELSEASQLPGAIARAIQLPLSPSVDPWEALCGFLTGRPVLLLLDNAEHLVTEPLALLCQTLLERLPLLRLLVTSRQVLGGSGESRFTLSTLPIQEGAVPLFLERARRVQPGFVESSDVVPLCEFLEGMPLAIELCAAWAGALSAQQMRERLERGEVRRLLTARDASFPLRHRSVEAAFLSSYERLSVQQQGLLRGLTVFRGGWTLEAAEAVCPTEDTLGDLLALTEASLVSVAEGRFSLLESLRQFATLLCSVDEKERLLTAHGDWVERLTAVVWDDPQAEEQALVVLEAERENLSVAVKAHLVRGQGEAAAERLVTLSPFYALRAHTQEARGFLEQALAAPGLSERTEAQLCILLGAIASDSQATVIATRYLERALTLLARAPEPLLEAQALWHQGRLAFLNKNFEQSQTDHERALALRLALHDTEGCARSYDALAQLAICRSDAGETHRLLALAEEAARQVGRSSLLTDILFNRGRLCLVQGDYETALLAFEACEERARRLSLPRLLAKVWNNLGEAARGLGDEVRARHAYLEAARTFWRLREQGATHFPLWNLGCLYGEWDHFDIGLVTLGVATRLWEELGRPLDEGDQETIERMMAQAAAVFGEERARYHWAEGRQLTPDEVLWRIERRQPSKA